MTLKIGQKVCFKFGRQPATAEGRYLASRRACNMTDAAYLKATEYKGEWQDLWAMGEVIGIDGEYVIVTDGYRVKASEVKAA